MFVRISMRVRVRANAVAGPSDPLEFRLFVRSVIWMDSAASNRGLSHISVEYLGDMDACPPIAFQANGNQGFKNMKIGQLIPFQTVSFMTVWSMHE